MLRPTPSFAALTGALVLQVTGAQTLPQVQFSHKDWEIVCDNTRAAAQPAIRPKMSCQMPAYC